MLLGCKKVEEVALNDVDPFGFRNYVMVNNMLLLITCY